MKRKRILPLILSAVMIFSAGGCGKTATVESKTHKVEPVYSLSFDAIGGKDVMPIGVWWGPYQWDWGSSDGNTIPDYTQKQQPESKQTPPMRR